MTRLRLSLSLSLVPHPYPLRMTPSQKKATAYNYRGSHINRNASCPGYNRSRFRAFYSHTYIFVTFTDSATFTDFNNDCLQMKKSGFKPR